MRLSKEVAKAIAQNELIGLEAEVTKSSDPSLIGVKGKVVNETLKTVVLESEGREKTLGKDSITLLVSFPEGKMEVEGKALMQRPHDRLKKVWRKM